VTSGNIYLMYVAGETAGRKIMDAIKRDPNARALPIAPEVVKQNLGLAGSDPTVGSLQTQIAGRITKARPDLLPFNRVTPFRR